MKRQRIYLASSWRNEQQPHLVKALRDLGHEVYDYKEPRPGERGFSWKDVGYGEDFIKSGNVTANDIAVYRNALTHPKAIKGFQSDVDAMFNSTMLVLLLPCGRSAHLEAGWATGAGKPTHIVLSTEKFEPELMYLLADYIHNSIDEFLESAWIK